MARRGRPARARHAGFAAAPPANATSAETTAIVERHFTVHVRLARGHPHAVGRPRGTGTVVLGSGGMQALAKDYNKRAAEGATSSACTSGSPRLGLA